MAYAMFFTAETAAADGSVTLPALWRPTKAKTLRAAQAAASRRRTLQGTALWVGVVRDDEFVAVAVKRGDPTNMQVKGEWVVVDC